MEERYKKVIVKKDISIKNALKQMNESAMQVLIVVDENEKIVGIVTDGDVRRGILNQVDFLGPVESITHKDPITLPYPANKSEALRLMKEYSLKHIPVINDKREVVDIILLNDFLESKEIAYPAKSTPVVIMAGGKGTRLDPFTKILPKPLIPIGEKPIIELIMDNFKKYGFHNFTITLNYKAEMIKMYFSENSTNYKVNYIEEKEYLGTVGAIALAKKELRETFILSNCDVVIDANFDSFLNYHCRNNNKITILAVSQYMKIPYGVLKTKGASLEEFIEKPEYHFTINSGIYAMEPEVLDLIPTGSAINAPELLNLAKERKFKVEVYPINSSWFDIGQWEDYKRAVDFIKKYNPLEE